MHCSFSFQELRHSLHITEGVHSTWVFFPRTKSSNNNNNNNKNQTTKSLAIRSLVLFQDKDRKRSDESVGPATVYRGMTPPIEPPGAPFKAESTKETEAGDNVCAVSSQRERERLYICSPVLSRLDYCNSLSSGCPQYLLDRLQKVQNAAARLVCKAKKSDHIHPCLLYTSPSPRDRLVSRMPSSA